MKATQDELEELRQKLEEAEEVRRAIIGGEVDAFVVGPGSQSRVLLLANAYQRYRQLVERMQQGAITTTTTGDVLFANQRFADLLGVSLAQLYTAPIESYATLGDRARLSTFLMMSARDSRLDLVFKRRDGTDLPVRLTLASFSDGYATLLVTDLRPLQWPALAANALESIRSSVEQLKAGAGGESRASLESIGEQVNGLARLLNEMIDVGAGAANK